MSGRTLRFARNSPLTLVNETTGCPEVSGFLTSMLVFSMLNHGSMTDENKTVIAEFHHAHYPTMK